ncbi:MAG: TonB-dependent receptor [Candidatus Kapaibacteriales bacterium]
MFFFRQIFLIAISLFLGFELVSQDLPKKIEVEIYDKISHEPIPYSGIFIKKKGHATGGIADSIGKISITFSEDFFPKDTVSLSVNASLYTSIERKVLLSELLISYRKEGVLHFDLFPKEILSKDIQVTAYLEKGERGLDSHTHIIADKELQEKMGVTLGALLENERGLSIGGMGPGSNRPVFRGLAGDRVLILQDGLPITDFSNSSPDHATAVDPIVSDGVMVIRGPKTLLYSPMGLGGVINVSSPKVRNPLTDHTIGSVSLSGESAYLGSSASFDFYQPISEGIGVKGYASQRATSDVRTGLGTLENSWINSRILGGNIGFTDEERIWEVTAGFEDFSMDYAVPGGFVGAHPSGVDIVLDRKSAQVSAAYHPHGKIVDDIRFDFGYERVLQSEYEASGILGAGFRRNTFSSNLVVDFHQNRLYDNLSIGAATSTRLSDFRAFISTPRNDQINIEPYIYWQKELYESINLSASVRGVFTFINLQEEAEVNRIQAEDRNFSDVSSSLALDWNVTESANIGIALYRSVRAPLAEELYSDGPHLAAYSYDIGNPTVGTESALGGELFSSIVVGDGEIRANVFYYDFSSFIQAYPTGRLNFRTQLPLFQVQGLAARLWGGEFELTQTLDKYGELYFNSSFTYGELDDASPLPMMPPIKGIARYMFPFEFADISLDMIYGGAQRRVVENEEPTDSYILFGFDISREFSVGSDYIRVLLDVDNVFDTVWYNHLSRIKAIMPEAGFNVRLAAYYYF